MVPRFPFQVVTLAIYIVTLVWTFRELHKDRWHSLWFIFLWLAHSVVFFVVILGRAFLHGFQDIPPSYFILWWANVVQLHGGLAMLSILWDVRRSTNG